MIIPIGTKVFIHHIKSDTILDSGYCGMTGTVVRHIGGTVAESQTGETKEDPLHVVRFRRRPRRRRLRQEDGFWAEELVPISA